jgi:phosphosulfolactate synthase (CoM biosynthesis protein A)
MLYKHSFNTHKQKRFSGKIETAKVVADGRREMYLNCLSRTLIKISKGFLALSVKENK